MMLHKSTNVAPHPSIISQSTFSWLSREVAESLLLYGALALAVWRFRVLDDNVIIRELRNLAICTALLLVVLRLWLVHKSLPSPSQDESRPLDRNRDGKRHTIPPLPQSPDQSIHWIFMTDGRNYRTNPDDGVLTALLIGPTLAASALYQTLSQINIHPTAKPRPASWLIEDPLVGSGESPLSALALSRHILVQITTLCSFTLLIHLCASRMWYFRFSKPGKPDPIPRGEVSRTALFLIFMAGTALLCVSLPTASQYLLRHAYIWPDLSTFDILIASLFYQCTLYIIVRLARRGFTLGEAGLVAQGTTVMFLEAVNLSMFKLSPQSTPFIKTFRMPSPLLIFQLALILGAIFTGCLLSPILVLSRHIAQKPSRRLRYPKQKDLQRRLLSGAFYVGCAIIVLGVIGIWARWCLHDRDPWLWVIAYLTQGSTPWSRGALIAYWGVLGCVTMAGWNSQLSRGGRNRPMRSPTGPLDSRLALEIEEVEPKDKSPGISHVATDILDATPLLGLNGRRKFFHALAVVMFAPGVVLDPAFCHLAFSVAFSLFIFVEYVRYFALYPFGASIHLFLSEFLDSKDSGSAILSHFYLLTGCAGPLWLEGSSPILDFTGILVLGVGDALASVVGKRYGRHRWAITSKKTIEGTVAFVISMFLCAMGLRALGAVESFSIPKYLIAASVGSCLEGVSMQNDNILLPFYTWALMVLLEL